MERKISTLASIDSIVHAMLWAGLCFSIIRNFELESSWYVVCAVVLTIEILLITLHQKITFPGIISYLGYESNKKLEDMKKFRVSDHFVNVAVMFVVVYFGIKT